MSLSWETGQLRGRRPSSDTSPSDPLVCIFPVLSVKPFSGPPLGYLYSPICERRCSSVCVKPAPQLLCLIFSPYAASLQHVSKLLLHVRKNKIKLYVIDKLPFIELCPCWEAAVMYVFLTASVSVWTSNNLSDNGRVNSAASLIIHLTTNGTPCRYLDCRFVPFVSGFA